MINFIRYIFAGVCALVSVLAYSASSVRISIEPSGTVPGVGDTFYLMIVTQNVNGTPAPVHSFPGCKVLFPLQQRNSSYNYSEVNGRRVASESKVSYAVTLRAETPGTYTFGPISVGGVKSNKVSYKIGTKSKNSAGRSASNQTSTPSGGPVLKSSDNGNLFLRATVSNSAPYEQQGVEYVVRLYTSYTSIFDWTAAASPKFGNCTYEASNDVSRSLSLAEYNGRAYESAVIARYIIYPTQPGIAKILGNSYTGSVAATYTYEDPFYGIMRRVQPKQIEAKPNDIDLHVRPLPAHEGVLNGVGRFKVSAQLISKRFRAHEAATVRYTVSGTGNLGFLSMPDLREIYPADIKFLKSDDSMKKQVGSSSVSGTVTFDCTVIPQREGDFKLPSVKFLFFDPEKGSYYTQETIGFNITVQEGSKTHDAHQNVVFIDDMRDPGTLSKSHRFYISSAVVWAGFVSPVLLLLVIVIFYRKHLALKSDISGMKMRKAGKIARKRLRAARECMRRKDAAGFYEEMLRALWGYIGDKLSMPTSELTRANVSERLLETGVSEKVVQMAIDIIDTCEYAKYGTSAGADMQSVYNRACTLIDNVESEIA